MDYEFINANDVMRAVLTNNMTACENQYASLEVSLQMQQALATDASLSADQQQMYAQQAVSTQSQMTDLDAQWTAWKTQLDALPTNKPAVNEQLTTE